jgi:starvation-inducible outer membrane lipoprotein
MKILTLLGFTLILAGCATPAPVIEKQSPQSTERSDRAHEDLDQEMNK